MGIEQTFRMTNNCWGTSLEKQSDGLLPHESFLIIFRVFF